MTNVPGLFLGQQSPESLWAVIQSVQRDDPLAPVTVVGPSNYANLSLRHEFARSGFANVRFLVLSRLAEYLGAQSLAREGKSPLSSVLEAAAIRVASSNASGQLRSVRSHPSTQQSLKRTFRELRYASENALGLLVTVGSLPAEVVGLYRQFQRLTSGYYDDEQLARAAARAVASGEATAFDDLGFVVLFELRDVTPAQRDLIQALASHGRCTVMLGRSEDDDADSPTERLVSQLSSQLSGPHRVQGTNKNAETHLLVAPDSHQEIRWVIRQIMYRAEQGTPFHRAAVLYRQADPYAALLREEMGLAGVPIAGPDTTTVAETAVGRALSGLMQIAEGDLRRDTVTAWLTGSPVQPPAERRSGTSFSPSLWDSISKKAGVIGGLDQWTSRLDLYADALERRAADGMAQEEISESRATRMQAEAASSRDLRGFVSELAASAAPPDDGNSWISFVDWLTGLLDRYMVRRSGMPEAELNALEKIETALAGLETAQSIEPAPSFRSFRRALDEILSARVGHLGVTGQGVFVAPIAAAAGMRFDNVYIVGMIEGAIPPAVRDDPLIPDTHRQIAGGASAGIALRSERRAEERYEYLSALQTAPTRVLTYPVGGSASQRSHSPSRWFLEQATILNSAPVYTSTLPSLSTADWLTVIPSMEGALETVAASSSADTVDYDVEHLWRWKRAFRTVGSHPLARAGRLGKSLRLRRGRYSARVTEWDGNLAGAATTSRYANRLTNAVHSPTSLERWARCPFSYFLGNVLRIGSTERPEDVHTITALERGSLIHEILEKFIRGGLEDDSIPEAGEPWSDHHRSNLHRIAQEAFRDAESHGVTGKPLMWELESEDIVNDLDTFLEQDANLRGRLGVSPYGAETEFGISTDSWQEAVCVLQDGSEIRFKGIIDRVDIAADGSRALVLDYKSGSARPYSGLEDDPVDHGKRLQLAVYGLAAQQALGPDTDIQAAYWFVTGRAGFAIAPSEPLDVSSGQTLQRVSEAATTIASGIRNGVFPANPGKEIWNGFENCNFCDFDAICPSRRGQAWDRKRNDSIVRDYRGLVDEE